jgi:phosphate-selective porin OprO/OprP
VLTPVEQQNADDPTFSGWYVESSYFLTGEHRPYRRQLGTFDRVIPFEDFFRVDTNRGVCTGLGAWQVAARLSHLDLDDATVAGGTLTDATLGVNWYLNPFTRLQFNYIHAFLDDPALDRSGADIIGMRAGFDY